MTNQPYQSHALDRQRIDAVLEQGIANGAVPGVVAMAADGDEVIYSGAFGKRSVDGAGPMLLDSVFWLTSMTKLSTSIGALQLVDAGRMALDDPAARYLPELADVQVLDGFAADGQPILRAPIRPITVRHLLSHTAGFAYPTWNATMWRYHQQTGISDFPDGTMASLRVPLVCDPGDQWAYGISTDWLGLIIEQVSGSSLDAYLQTRVFAPIGMVDTGFVLRPDIRVRFADLHYRQPDGSLEALPFEDPGTPEFHAGGSDLFGTGPDYLRLLRMLLGNGELDGVRLLQSVSVAELRRNQIGDLTAGSLTSVNPGLSNDYNLFPEMDKRWGLAGFITPEDASTGRGRGAVGGGGMYNCFYWVDSRRQIAGLFLAQVLPFSDRRVLDLFLEFETAVYAGVRG